jgi:hypothetical protein
MTNASHGISKKIGKEIGDLEAKKENKGENKNVLNSRLTTMAYLHTTDGITILAPGKSVQPCLGLVRKQITLNLGSGSAHYLTEHTIISQELIFNLRLELNNDRCSYGHK